MRNMHIFSILAIMDNYCDSYNDEQLETYFHFCLAFFMNETDLQIDIELRGRHSI